MNLMIIGAGGGIGKQTVRAALAEGHRVVAVLRHPEKLPLRHPDLEVVQGDILRPETFDAYLRNQDAVVSAIGIKGTGPTTLYSQGTALLLDRLKENGPRRAYFISASALVVSPMQTRFVRWFTRSVLQKVLRNMYADLLLMEREIKESDVDWTIVRPPRLTDGPPKRTYRFAVNGFLKNCLSISRADLADYILRNLTNRETYKATVEVAY